MTKNQKYYLEDKDYLFYLRLLREYSRHFGVAVQAYCLMPNHVHLILSPPKANSLGCLMQRLNSDYARTLHLQLGRVGHLWQSRYYSTPMDESHFWHAMVYVEQNPPRAKLVQRCLDWPWSSAGAHLRGAEDNLLDMNEWRQQYTPESWKNCLELGLQDAMLLQRIRESTGKGWPLGSANFLANLERDLGRSVQRRVPGPRARSGVKVSDPDLCYGRMNGKL